MPAMCIAFRKLSSFRFSWTLLFCLIVSTLHASSESKPNIVILFADDVEYGDIGYYGATHIRTPHIDRLARQGRRFTDAHSASAACSPSRYGLMTRRYPVRHGTLWSHIFLRRPLVIDPDRTTIADIAKRAGYATTCIGKWHLGFGRETPTNWNTELKPGPLELGFDSFFGIPVVNSHPLFVFIGNHRVLGWDSADPLVNGEKAKTRVFDEKFRIDQIGGADKAYALYDGEKVGTELMNRARRWITQQSQSETPFFLYFASHAIHHPFSTLERQQQSGALRGFHAGTGLDDRRDSTFSG
jgi:arylsulfatase A